MRPRHRDNFRQELASRQDDAVEGSSRPVEGHEEAMPTSSGHLEWSCAHNTSTLIIQDAHRLAKRYGLEVDMAIEVHRVHKPPKGYAMLLESFLKFGVQFPLKQFFRDIFCFYGLTVFQVMPMDGLT